MKTSIQFLTVLLLVASLRQDSSAEEWWRINGEPHNREFISRKFLNEKSTASAELKSFLQQIEFEDWVTYEDDWVKLRYPKHHLLTFERKDQGDQIRVNGSVLTTVDNRFRHAYCLTAGEAVYGVFLLQVVDWLDDGGCFCGPMVHHVYNIENECLVRFSLLPGGAVKKAQVLGEQMRLMSFEWTHLQCPRTVYEIMVESMELKVPLELTTTQIKAEVDRRYGIEGRTGLVQRGMPIAEAIKYMGEPVEQTETRMTWHDRRGDYRVKAVLKIKDQKVEQLMDESVVRISDEPIEGTLSWVKLQIPDPNEFVGEELEPGKVTEISEDVKAKAVEICLSSIRGERAWEAHGILQLLAEEYDFCSPQVVDFFKYGDRVFDSFEFDTFDLYRRKKAITDESVEAYLHQLLDRLAAIDPYAIEMSADSWGSPSDACHQVFLRAYRLQRMLAPEAAKKTLASFTDGDQLGYRLPIINELLDEFSPEQQFQVLLSSILIGSENENLDLLKAALDGVAGRSWSDPAEKTELKEAIGKMQSLPDTRRWRGRRMNALNVVE